MKNTSLMVLALLGAGCGGNSETGLESAEIKKTRHPRPSKLDIVAEQINIVSDQEGVAPALDPDLKNAWGLAFNPRGAAWVSAAETNLSPVYDAAGNVLLKVSVPKPTGQVFNPRLDTFLGDVFIIVTETGLVTGWQPGAGTVARIRVDNSASGAIYKGIALAESKGGPRIYVTDFHNAKIDVFTDLYAPITLEGSFTDPNLPCGYAPFNLIVHDDLLYVTFALQDAAGEDDVAGPGNGYLSVFDLEGNFVTRLISQGALNAPWGMAFAPWQLKGQAVELLVGNFGDGRINRYRISMPWGKPFASFGGPIVDRLNMPIEIDGLWAIVFGPGAGGFSADDLFFTAGPDEEEHGLFGKLVFSRAPEKPHW
jgi:uncharacterized protein (TIGR03118 family)